MTPEQQRLLASILRAATCWREEQGRTSCRDEEGLPRLNYWCEVCLGRQAADGLASQPSPSPQPPTMDLEGLIAQVEQADRYEPQQRSWSMGDVGMQPTRDGEWLNRDAVLALLRGVKEQSR